MFMMLTDESADVLEVSTQMNISERRNESAPKVDSDFFNRFDDDFDESDMSKPTA
jgi:hypothetical protein